MTRDEAIEISFAIMIPVFPNAPHDRLREIAACEVDLFAALGVLKLDLQTTPPKAST